MIPGLLGLPGSTGQIEHVCFTSSSLLSPLALMSNEKYIERIRFEDVEFNIVFAYFYRSTNTMYICICIRIGICIGIGICI